MQDIQQEIRRLEQDLNNALEMSNRAITDRRVIFFLPKKFVMKMVVQDSLSIWFAGCGFMRRSSCYFSNYAMLFAR